MKKYLITAGLITLAALAYTYRPGEPKQAEEALAESAALAEVVLPASFSKAANTGRGIYASKCAACHGENAAGQAGIAPPLVHKIYEPSHHGDSAFQLAVSNGTRQHHWPFGDMPPVEGLTTGDVKMIIAYIRELQRANGVK